MKRKILLFTLALPVLLTQNLLAQTSSRLIGMTDLVNTGASFVPTDSTSYTYSGGRGGDLAHTLKYDNSTTWAFQGDTAFNNEFYYIQTFDGNNNIISYISEYWSGTGWVFSTNTLYNYDGSNRVTSSILQSWGGTSWVPVSKDSFTYAGSNLVEDQYQVWSGLTANFSTAAEKIYYYDPVSGKRINETDVNLVAGSPVNQSKVDYSYTSGTNPMLASTTNSMWNGAAWVKGTMVSNTYDTTGDLINTLTQSWDTTNNVWVNNTLHSYSGFAAGTMNPAMDIYQTWDTAGGGAWNNIMQFSNIYNGNNQLTSNTGVSWNVLGRFEQASGDPMTSYSYESYTPSNVFTPVVVAGQSSVNIYPVPAQNTLHVDLNWAQAQTATVVIYDATGRVMRQWDAPMGTENHSAVSVNNMPAGTYFVKVLGTQEQMVKQFVIAH